MSQIGSDEHARHVPVMVDRCLELFAPALATPGASLIDATLGMGGHSEAILRAFPEVKVIGIDRDKEALAIANSRLAVFGNRFVSVHATYDQIATIAQRFGTGGKVDGILMDLGVSSLQLDEVARGFSYSRDAELDMRMDTSSGRSAKELLAQADQAQLRTILRTFGEEKFAGRIAAKIVAAREKEPLERTGQLVDIVRESIPAPARRKGGNPAKRTFQALRIAVNDELGILAQTLPQAINSLKCDGRIVIESYQSLEDRLVKHAFADGATVLAPPDLPVIPQDAQPILKLLTRGAEKASSEEQEINPRSAPVRLRAAQKINDRRLK